MMVITRLLQMEVNCLILDNQEIQAVKEVNISVFQFANQFHYFCLSEPSPLVAQTSKCGKLLEVCCKHPSFTQPEQCKINRGEIIHDLTCVIIYMAF